MSTFQTNSRKVLGAALFAGQIFAYNFAKLGKFVGRQVVDGYKMIDPDVTRHFAHFPILGYSLFVPRNDEIIRGKSDGNPPLVFVHGLGGDRGNFLLMDKFLWLSGRKRSYRIHLNPKSPITEMSRQLAGYITNVLDITGEPRVEIIAHSMGGVVSRMAILDFGLEKKVRTLITLGAPHNGTYPARYGCTDNILSLRPDSEIVTRLKKAGWPKNVKGFTLWSKNDLLILPAESAKVDGACQIDMTPLTHFSYLFDPRSWIMVEKCLSSVKVDLTCPMIALN